MPRCAEGSEDLPTWTLQGVPYGWERVPLSKPLGFKHHPLEGAATFGSNLWYQCRCKYSIHSAHIWGWASIKIVQMGGQNQPDMII